MMKNGVFWVVTPCGDTILHSHRRENLKSYISNDDLGPTRVIRGSDTPLNYRSQLIK
jgi:hypothetical protein